MVHGRPVLGLLAYQLDHLWFGDVEERRDYQVGRNRCLNLPLSVGHDAHVDHAVNEPELPSAPVVLEGPALSSPEIRPSKAARSVTGATATRALTWTRLVTTMWALRSLSLRRAISAVTEGGRVGVGVGLGVCATTSCPFD